MKSLHARLRLATFTVVIAATVVAFVPVEVHSAGGCGSSHPPLTAILGDLGALATMPEQPRLAEPGWLRLGIYNEYLDMETVSAGGHDMGNDFRDRSARINVTTRRT